MTDLATSLENNALPKRTHGHKTKERLDISSGQLLPPEHMVRIAFGPDGLVVPDPGAKLPGRGAWIIPSRDAVAQAIKSGAFNKAAKAKVNVPANLADLIETALRKRVLGMLALANKAGVLVSGFDKVRASAALGELALRFEASDGSADGRSKIRVITKAVAQDMDAKIASAIGCFDAGELGRIIGRQQCVHIGIKKGAMARAIEYDIRRLAGFCALIPPTWSDYEHEAELTPIYKDVQIGCCKSGKPR